MRAETGLGDVPGMRLSYTRSKGTSAGRNDELSCTATQDGAHAPFRPHRLLRQHLRRACEQSRGGPGSAAGGGLTFNGMHCVYPRKSLCSLCCVDGAIVGGGRGLGGRGPDSKGELDGGWMCAAAADGRGNNKRSETAGMVDCGRNLGSHLFNSVRAARSAVWGGTWECETTVGWTESRTWRSEEEEQCREQQRE